VVNIDWTTVDTTDLPYETTTVTGDYGTTTLCKIGVLVIASGQHSTATSSSILGYVPAGWRPNRIWTGVGVGAGNIFGKITVQANGQLTLVSAMSSGSYVRLDGFCWTTV